VAKARFVYYQSMNVHPDLAVSRIAAAIGEPARARILYRLVDGHARTSTELAVVAGVSPSTASVHLNLLRAARLVTVVAQGKHRYYSLTGKEVANALEGLSVLAGFSPGKFIPNTPIRLRVARTCYDHIAGRLGVLLHNRFRALGLISADASANGNGYDMTPKGAKAFGSLGIDISEIRSLRRKFAYPCLDWSERQPHIGGAFGAALLKTALKLKWIIQDLDSRSLRLTSRGEREMASRFGIDRVELVS
jgi:DNA-binding transcriptional ArsR family regulator